MDVRARYGSVVIDLRSPQITADVIEVAVDIDHGMIKILAPENAVIDQQSLAWTGRGRVKDTMSPATGDARVVRLTGTVTSGEIRVHRGGVAMLSAMCSRDYVEELRRARTEGPQALTADDPTRG